MDESTTKRATDGQSDLRNASRGQRLQRVMAEAGIASRRVCEQLIEAGRVKVNGQVVSTLPAWVDPAKDRVLVDGQPVQKPEPHVYIMLNKPARTLATPPEGPDDARRSALAMVEHPLSARLFAAGRLDYDATGLLLLTNDGELANRLTHARYGVEKTYQLVVRGTMDDAALDRVNRAIGQVTRRAAKEAGTPRAARADLKIVAKDQGRTVLEMSVRDGRAVLVRDTLAALGHPVKNMERVAIGPLRLTAVAPGQWRELDRDELIDLRRVASGKPARSKLPAVAASGDGAKPRRRPGPATETRRIAKRFRGIGKPVEDVRAGSRKAARPAKPARPTRPLRGAAAIGPEKPGPVDRRRGRGDAINAYRKKPAKVGGDGKPRTPRDDDAGDRPRRGGRSERSGPTDRGERAGPSDRSGRSSRPNRAGPAGGKRGGGPDRAGRPGRRDKGAPR